MKKHTTFALKRPCTNCPFRNDDRAIELNEGRKDEIMLSILKGDNPSFSCHKTIYSDSYNVIDKSPPREPSVCPGAAAVARKFGRDMVIIQVATRMGVITDSFLDDALERTISPEDLSVNPKDAHL